MRYAPHTGFSCGLAQIASMHLAASVPNLLHSAPAGWSTLGRNGALAAVAAFVVWQGRDDPGLSAVAWLGELATVELVSLGVALLALALVAAQLIFLLDLLRQNGRLLLRVEALERGGKEAASAPPRRRRKYPPSRRQGCLSAPRLRCSRCTGSTARY